MSGLTFAQPMVMLIAVLALPAVAVLWYFNFQMRERGKSRYGNTVLLSRVSIPVTLKDELPVFAVWAAAVFLVVLSCADPVLPAAPAIVSNGSIQVVVVIDVSNSMAQEYYRRDMAVPEGEIPAGSFGTCLDMAKQLTINEIMPAIRGNEIGVVGYAGRGFPQAELTHDLESVTWVLRHWMKVKDVPGVGSDYAAGLRQAVDIFLRSENGDRQRVIVLFSDGGFTGNESELGDVLQLLEDHGISLVVVAVGSPVPMAIPMYDNRNRYIGDFPGNGNVELVKTDESKLRSLAAQAGGVYIRLLTRQQLNIDWARTLASERAVTEFSHVYQIPLSLAALIFAALLLRGLRRAAWRRP